MCMKVFNAVLFTIVVVLSAAAQKPDEILATATGHTFRLQDLPADLRTQMEKLPSAEQNLRTSLIEQMIDQAVLDAEAKAQRVSTGVFIAREKAKVADPPDAELKAVYERNRSALGEQTFEQSRKQIVAALRREPEQKHLADLVKRLKIKYKAAITKDVNTPNLAPATPIATVNGQTITLRQFDETARLDVYHLRADYSDFLLTKLNDAIFYALVADEAKSQGIDSGALIAREITNKMREFSDEEEYALKDSFSKTLYDKYKVKILYREPAPPAQNISMDDDPAIGPAAAPVKVVMFSDFQCSACAATHPVLKKAIAEYPGKVRFVVRDFPLESIHENAFDAARAASAAHAQGKFFEYADILYEHQSALDAASLKKYAVDIGLNVKQFELDSKSEKTAAEIRKDIADGESYAITGTPTIFVNGVRVRHLSLAAFRSAIERAMAQ